MKRGNYIRAALISILVGGIIAYVTFQFTFSNFDLLTLSFSTIVQAIFKTILGYCFFPYLIALGIAGIRIEKLRQDGESMANAARGHALMVNVIFWISYLIIYYISDLSNFGSLIGLGVPILGLPLGILFYSISISRIISYVIFTFDENKGVKIRFGE